MAKIEKYAASESGDTVEVIERPHGGVSVVLVDGQRSGKSAKTISNLVARKAISLLAEGVRDGAAARASHDYLRTHRRGQVSAELVIMSADLETGTLVISRNSRAPVLLYRQSQWQLIDSPSQAVGIYARTRPQIDEVPLRPGMVAIGFSDGVLAAGEREGNRLDLLETVQSFPLTFHAKTYADEILALALRHERGRPRDDLTVVVFKVGQLDVDNVRRMSMTLPVPPKVFNAWG